ncbi:MAG: MFS transporter [Bacteroidia bacterium]|nr:MAG: MFS transporter [Bacteroidia bacterium]
MNYIVFFRNNPRILLYGVLLVFFSSFGQTFIVSLYIPSFLESFGISSSFFSALYAGATLLSASTLVFIGKKIDHIPLKRFTLFVIAGIMAACLLTAISGHVVLLFFGIYSLRLFGQGLLSHTALTTMSRYFKKARGKALGIAYLGFPLGESIFPILVAAGIALLGWRETLLVSASLVVLVLLPLSLTFLRGFSRANIKEEHVPDTMPDNAPEESEKSWTQRSVLGSAWFYLIAPTVFLVGFLQTALFFFQTFIAEFKTWTTEWMAGSIIAYAISSSLTSVASGPLIDRVGARKIFPFVLIPLAMGVLLLSLGSHPVLAPLYWLLVGFTGGINAPVTSALYAEIFGTRSLGAVRSIFTFVMVVSTALGPLVYSFFLDRGFHFDQIHYGVIVVIIINMLYIRLSYQRHFSRTKP